MKTLLCLALALSLGASPALAQQSEPAPAAPESAAKEEAEPRKKRPILFYIPNRIFDLLDIVRARVRFGPGIAASARATRPLSVTVGAYTSVWAGIPGPRNRARVAWPVGLENLAGLQVGPIGAQSKAFNPDYGPTEIGLGVQAAIVGVDVGVGPLDFVDFFLGFLTIDIRDDDF